MGRLLVFLGVVLLKESAGVVTNILKHGIIEHSSHSSFGDTPRTTEGNSDVVCWWKLTLPSLFSLTSIRMTPQHDTTLEGVTVFLEDVEVGSVRNVVAGQVVQMDIGPRNG